MKTYGGHNALMDTLSWIIGYHSEHGWWPTIREIAQGTGFHRYTVAKHLAKLMEQDYLYVEPHSTRAMRVLKKPNYIHERCQVEGCAEPINRAGWCAHHYYRLRVLKQPASMLRPRTEEERQTRRRWWT